jgi:hypothetical protein
VLPSLTLTSMTGESVAIPDPGGRLVHLQFRRFAGCPICDLHLRSITGRLDEIEAAGVREVAIFHSTDAELRKYESELPIAAVGDPRRELYRQYGVEVAPRSVLSPGALASLPLAWWHTLRDAVRLRRPPRPARPTGGSLGLPADLLIAGDGTVLAAKYGAHASDQWSVDEILAHAAGAA